MMKTLTKIDAFFTEADSRFALSGTYDDQTLTLFDGDTFFDEVDYCYSERAILTRTDTPLEEFYKLFQRWSEGKGYGFIRSYAALLIEYNPTHNYDGTETVTTTTEFGKVVENESEGTTTNTPTLTSTTERSMYGYNSSTDVDADKAVTTAGGEDKTEASGSGSVTESGTETVTVETEKGGNLGLTTNAQLLTGELKLRMYDLQKEAIANFINEYTVEYMDYVLNDSSSSSSGSGGSSGTDYSAGNGIDITNGVISINDATLLRLSTVEGQFRAVSSEVGELAYRMTTAEGEIDDLQESSADYESRIAALEGGSGGETDITSEFTLTQRFAPYAEFYKVTIDSNKIVKFRFYGKWTGYGSNLVNLALVNDLTYLNLNYNNAYGCVSGTLTTISGQNPTNMGEVFADEDGLNINLSSNTFENGSACAISLEWYAPNAPDV